MRIAIDHYLSCLTERDELDVLLRNLLVVEGYEVVKKASRGKREFGVDVAAVKREADGHHLYLFQVKAGDLDRATWNVGQNSVRSSLEEAVDKPFEAFTVLQAPPIRRHLIVVFNGYVKDDVADMLDGFVGVQTKYHSDTEITYWNISTLGEKIQTSLVNEGLIPIVDAMLLKKTLAFADVPGYQFAELKKILGTITTNQTSSAANKIRRLFNTVRIMNRMVGEYARQGETYKNAVIASEITILHLAHWCQTNCFYTPTIIEHFDYLLEDYALDLQTLFEKLLPSIRLQHGLALGGFTEQVEYPVRTFEILGLASVYALVKMHLGHSDYKQALTLVDLIISNNPSSHRPLLDNNGVDICLAALAFLYDEAAAAASSIGGRVLTGLVKRKRLDRPLPELYNNLDSVIEAIGYGTKPKAYVDSSSTMLTMLFEFLLFDRSEEITELYNDYRKDFEEINLQVWYPSAKYGDKIFSQELRDGLMETHINLPNDLTDFDREVKQRHQNYSSEWLTDAFSNRVNGFIVFMAFRHFKTPVFPFFWRDFME